MLKTDIETNTKKVKQEEILASTVFAGKDIPAFLKEHKAFKAPAAGKEPITIKKIFPTIGLSNFKEPCALIKPSLDLKKENFVSALIQVMLSAAGTARDQAQLVIDKIQFIQEGEEQAANLDKIDNIFNLLDIIKNLIPQIDTYNNAYEKVIQGAEGKITLRLAEDVNDKNGKPAFRKNESLFKVFNKLKELCATNNIEMISIEQTNEFKTFSAENVAQKNYSVVFTAEGKEGAWDLLTMSMRGIQSCQTWTSDYPRCLIGSILSKFTGIIYITSGTDVEGRGAKMMRRSIVRYAIDADAHEPCILIDKIYPKTYEDDAEALKIFTDALQKRTSLPIYYSFKLGNKAKHFYIPFEKVREEIPARDWSYQDTPLKTDIDFQLHILASATKEDVSRYINCFRAKLIAYLGEYFRDVIMGAKITEPEVKRTVSNIRLNHSIDKFNEQIVYHIFHNFIYDIPKTLTNPKDCYRKYLMDFALKLKNIRVAQQTAINIEVDKATSRTVNHKEFTDFIFGLVAGFTKQELKNLVN